MGRQTSRLVANRHDRGALSPAVAILAVMIFALAGLVIDGGRQLGAKSRAVGYAQEAARAGAAAIQLNSDAAKIDTTKAAKAVADFCAQVSANDSAVTKCGPSELDDQHLQVKVRIVSKTTFLGMIGIQNLPANGVGEARAEQGVKKAGETPTIPPIVVDPSSEGPGAPITTAVPPTLDIPCPDWTIGTSTPPWDYPFPFPPTCTPNITPPPTAPTGSTPTPSPSPSHSPGGGGHVAARNSAPPSGGG